MVSLRIDEALLDAVDRAGSAERRARSEVVREALELWLRRRSIAERVQRHREGYARKPVARDEFSPILGAQTWPK
jgi:metal-responsive CopG/Arc/MetJ family transcriptional regulator